MTVIKYDDLVETVAGALQFISYYHPTDYIRHLARAYEAEQSPAAKDAIAQILTNSRMCAEGHRPLCQDTGIVNVFLKVGMDVRWRGLFRIASRMPSTKACAAATSIPTTCCVPRSWPIPQFERKNTKDNTPAVIHMELVPGNTVDVTVAAKGGGSENKSKFVMLNPSDSVVDWVLKTVPTMGAGWCPPGMLGIGIGGTAEKAMLMAKESLMEPLDMYELLQRGPAKQARGAAHRALREGQCAGHRRPGPGRPGHRARRQDRDVPDPRGLQAGGDDPELRGHPPCALRARRLGPGLLRGAELSEWPDVNWVPDTQRSKRVDLDTLTREEVASWTPGQTLLLSGKMLTGRDAAHKRIEDMLAKGEPLPVDFANRVIYYVGPVDPVRDEAVGPAGPTTATRMDKFTDMMLSKTGLISMIGKAERGPVAIEAIRKHRAAYLMAVGGAAYLVSKAIKSAKVLGFADLGMEAIYEFEVKDMPVTVAVDSSGHLGASRPDRANGRPGSARFRSASADPTRRLPAPCRGTTPRPRASIAPMRNVFRTIGAIVVWWNPPYRNGAEPHSPRSTIARRNGPPTRGGPGSATRWRRAPC
jgi:fumarate hydratase class I